MVEDRGLRGKKKGQVGRKGTERNGHQTQERGKRGGRGQTEWRKKKLKKKTGGLLRDEAEGKVKGETRTKVK